ncbi:MAG: hypothetical protein NXI00_02060 [Cytophagales bacterium]|nr:hypothetical protein [Cytophagales bacterium]
MIKKKRLFFSVLLISACTMAFGQETKMVINQFKPFKKVNTLGLYIAPEIQYGMMAGSFTPLAGLNGMVQVNKRWGVGASAFSTITDFAPKQLSSSNAYNFNAKFGGLNIEYTPKPENVVHMSFPLLVGAGMSEVSIAAESEENPMRDEINYEADFDQHTDNKEGSETFAIIQPGINLESNLFKYGKVFIGAKYRLAMGKSGVADSANPIPVSTASQLNGFSFSAGLKIGIFEFPVRKAKKN